MSTTEDLYYIFYEIDIGDPRGCKVSMMLECSGEHLTEKIKEIKKAKETILAIICGKKLASWRGELL